MLALGAVIMLCAVAIIGAGYAAFSNTATARTYNEGNSATAGYMTLTPGAAGSANWDAISADVDVALSSYVYNSGIAYYFADESTSPVTVDSTAGYTVASLGSKDIVITNQTGGDISTVDFVVKQDKVVGNADFIYIVCVNGVYKALQYTGDVADITFAITIDTDTTTAENEPLADGESYAVSVSLCIGYVANCQIPTSWIGAVTAGTEGTGTLARNQGAPVDIESTNALAFAFKVVDTTTP